MAGIDCSSLFYGAVHLIESQIKGLKNARGRLCMSILVRCPSHREVKKMTSEWRALTVAVCFRELFILERVK